MADRPDEVAVRALLFGIFLTIPLILFILVSYAIWVWGVGSISELATGTNLINSHLDVFVATLPYVYVGTLAILATLFAIAISSTISRQNQRKQETMRILLQETFSTEYSSWKRVSIDQFPHGVRISANKFFKYKNSRSSKFAQKRKGVEATIQLMDYYEFMAGGIMEGNLDESMIKTTIRGIVCQFVFTISGIILKMHENKNNITAGQNLVNLYWRWVEEKFNDEWDPEMIQGPNPTDKKSIKRKNRITRKYKKHIAAKERQEKKAAKK